MKPEGSLLHLQAPATRPFREPEQSSFSLPLPFLENPF